MKASILLFPARKFPSVALPKGPMTLNQVFANTLSTRFRTGRERSGHPVLSSQESRLRLILGCLYMISAVVVCWSLFDVLLHYLPDYFVQLESLMFR